MRLVITRVRLRDRYIQRITFINLKCKFVIVSILCLFFSLNVYSQRNQENNTYPNSFLSGVDKIYGADDLLINGSIYLPRSSLIEGHPYFETDIWSSGTLYISGRTFRNEQIKYNLETDKIILNALFKESSKVKIVLNTYMVDSFYIADHFFINGTHLFTDDSSTTFYEVIYRGGFLFLSKYKKEYLAKYSVSNSYGLFSGQHTEYFILNQGMLCAVNNKRAFFSYFESYKGEIKRFMKKNHIRFRKATIEQMKQLLTFTGGMMKG